MFFLYEVALSCFSLVTCGNDYLALLGSSHRSRLLNIFTTILTTSTFGSVLPMILIFVRLSSILLRQFFQLFAFAGSF